MATTNRERVGKALETLSAGLGPFVDQEVQAGQKSGVIDDAILSRFTDDARMRKRPVAEWDAAALLKLMSDQWHTLFRKILGHTERSFVSELREHRNRWAHQESFSSDDAYRVLDTTNRLLTAISAPQAADTEKLKMELLRVRFDDQARHERRKTASLTIASGGSERLKPWREIATPHRDVASGRYQQAEFAADLWQVQRGEGSHEYQDAGEFFRRTYLTDSLKSMLRGAVRRLKGQGGNPVVQLQTNFGGGKTHSMLALYHLFSGIAPTQLSGVDAILENSDAKSLPAARRAVLVGTKISPGAPMVKNDGTQVHTLWGELAWQLGGAAAYSRIKADDQHATNPGDALREILAEHGPCLILIDEWVSYARQLHDQSDLPGGTFETQFTFAQTLTESAKAVNNCLLVISLPASDSADSRHTHADDIEVGGQRGREALQRLRNVTGRIEASFRPATPEEGFEIVRRRLFEPYTDDAKFKDRDVVARAFSEMYRKDHPEFPPECRTADYEKRLKAAYPIHPEVFDRLYADWSTLVTFQRTRGVLRLMAAVIHNLWASNDRSPLIMPANLSIDDPQVLSELTRYLPDNWAPVIQKDVDGPASLPRQIDQDVSNLGKYSACRRVARTVYLGSAPTAGTAQRGIEDRRIKLGCVAPGESPAIFGDALRRLASTATYLYQDGPRYWYDTRPTVTKLAEDRAEQLLRDHDRVTETMHARLRTALKDRSDFARVHPVPRSDHDVPDERETRLVVLGTDHPHQREGESPARAAATKILESRGTGPRLYRNTLVFLAADQSRLQDLDEAVRQELAWRSILEEKEQLELSRQQIKQAETQLKNASDSIAARLPETYQWLLTPVQAQPADPITFEASRMTGQDPLAERAARKLKNDDLLAVNLAGTVLATTLDEIPLWRGDHVHMSQLIDDFAQYVYLRRLKGPDVVIEAAKDGLGGLLWQNETFAYADTVDDDTGQYRGLRADKSATVLSSGLLVKPEIALRQMEVQAPPKTQPEPEKTGEPPEGTPDDNEAQQPVPASPKRFHGTVTLDPTRTVRDAERVADEVIQHLSGVTDAMVTVTLEISAEMPNGTPDNVVRTVAENSRTLKFESHSFESE